LRRADRRQQQLTAERARADMLQRFLGDATHDLLMPITIMNTSIYLGLRSQELEQVHQRLHIIQAQATYLHTMITDMLTMLRVDDPTTTFSFRIDDLTPQIARIMSEFEPLAQSKQQAIRLQSEGGGLVRYDELTMGRALKNLIQNAHKYTPTSGIITVRTRCEDHHFAIDVSDTGVGIPPDELNHIFDRFYRVEAHRPIDGGSGPGLAIVKKDE
jgi:signal transduction histidine kinase